MWVKSISIIRELSDNCEWGCDINDDSVLVEAQIFYNWPIDPVHS